MNINANSQCATVSVLNEDFSSFKSGDYFPVNCWGFTKDPSSISGSAYIMDDGTSNVVVLMGSSNQPGGRYLVTPALSTINGNYHLKFDAKLMSSLAAGSTLEIGTLDNQSNASSFKPVGSPLNITTTSQTLTSAAIPMTPGHNYVAIKLNPGGNISAIVIDNIIWEPSTSNNPCLPISSLDEDFETFTKLPENCWETNKKSPQIDIDIDKSTGNHSVSLYSFMSANDPIYLVSPELSNIDGNHLLEFDILKSNASSSAIEIGTMTDNNDYTTFSKVGGSINPIVGKHASIKVPANPGHKYVAIKYIPNNVHQAIYIDNIKWTTTADKANFVLNDVKIYPNPTSGIFNIDTELDIKQIEVYNAQGQKVLKTDSRFVDLKDAGSGLYIITITTNDGTQGSYKLIKK